MSAPLRVLLLLACLCAAGLAGCSSAPSAEKLAATGPDPAGAREVAFRSLGHAGIQSTLHSEVWANGTVDIGASCNTGGCIMGTEKAEHPTDLTPLLPRGVPTRVQVDLAYQPNQLQGSVFIVFLRSAESTVYLDRLDAPRPGVEVRQTVLRPQGEVSVVMLAEGPGGQAPSTPYQLKVTIDADPHGVPPGVPMAVALGPGETLRAAAPNGGPAPFALYGPDDALIGRFVGNHTLPAMARAGDYVALLPSDGPWGNLSTDGSTTTMKALGLLRTWGAPITLPPNGVVDAPWDVPGNPLGVGLLLESKSPMMASVGVSASIRGPGGFAFDPGQLCGVCLTGDYTIDVDSGTGDPGVTAGSYTVHGETQGTYEVAVTPFSIAVQR